MEEFVVYILYSERFNKNYTGFTSNLIEGFKSNNHLGFKGFSLNNLVTNIRICRQFS